MTPRDKDLVPVCAVLCTPHIMQLRSLHALAISGVKSVHEGERNTAGRS